MNRDTIWAVDVVAKPSSSPRSVPLLDPAYWIRVQSDSAPEVLHDQEDWKETLDDTGAPDPNLLVGSPSTLTMTSYIGPGGTCAAFRGTWHGVAIVAKYIQSEYSTPFVDEARAYLGGLAPFQGTVVPGFFGLYRSDYFALLVFEDCGNRISDWDDLDLQERCVHATFFPAIAIFVDMKSGWLCIAPYFLSTYLASAMETFSPGMSSRGREGYVSLIFRTRSSMIALDLDAMNLTMFENASTWVGLGSGTSS
jgi:hypothetical protein